MHVHWHLAPHHRFLLISATVIMALTALFAASLLGTDLLRRTHAEQSPDGCISNDFVLNVQKSLRMGSVVEANGSGREACFGIDETGHRASLKAGPL